MAVSKKSLCLNIRKYKLTGSVADRCTYKPPKKLNDAHYRFIDNAMAENDELSTPKLYATQHTYVLYVRVKALRKYVCMRICNASALVHVGLSVINTTFTRITRGN